jgi:hypothetical protein
MLAVVTPAPTVPDVTTAALGPAPESTTSYIYPLAGADGEAVHDITTDALVDEVKVTPDGATHVGGVVILRGPAHRPVDPPPQSDCTKKSYAVFGVRPVIAAESAVVVEVPEAIAVPVGPAPDATTTQL